MIPQHSAPAFMAVALCDLAAARGPHERYKQRRRIERMLRRYDWDLEIARLAQERLAELHAEPAEPRL